ncbi:unnamed protein product [Caenorhabditis sp. 36 PRJEB53466]|nr:unnamed protein product [Caenorhabditis sp. 36 PRJEB53466]
MSLSSGVMVVQLDVKEEPKSRMTSPGPVAPPTIQMFPQPPAVCTFDSLFSSLSSPLFGCASASDNVNQLAKLLLMITNSTANESNRKLDTSEPSTFHFDWNTTLKEEYDMVEKLNSPQYTNLTSTSPPSSSGAKSLTLRTIQIPKIESTLLNHCAICNFPIVDKEISVIDNKGYHHQCVRCSMCDVPLGFTDKCYVRDGSLYCRTDHVKRYQKCCMKCEIPLNRDDMVMRAKDLIFHHACFICYICGTKLNPGDYYTMSPQGHVYCHAHYNVVRSTALCEEPAAAPTVVVAAPPPEPLAREPSTEAEGSTDEEQTSGHQRSKRMRTSFKHHQLRAMKTYFALNHNPDAKDLKQLAAKTNLTKRVLQVR